MHPGPGEGRNCIGGYPAEVHPERGRPGSGEDSGLDMECNGKVGIGMGHGSQRVSVGVYPVHFHEFLRGMVMMHAVGGFPQAVEEAVIGATHE